jgi:hypothetical protein
MKETNTNKKQSTTLHGRRSIWLKRIAKSETNAIEKDASFKHSKDKEPERFSEEKQKK